ncbi:MAG: LacI family DNA-binding transcriptional regulator [Gammaproteobacteria bacterium]|nr:LacI family DNA-binding transcriptional regulator [Gammaproteobacteria bacterium]
MELENATAGRRGATIREVADRAGVSIKTVSRVVNNEPNVRPETRDRVLKAVADLDYEPLPAARGLAGRRTFSIGLLYENPHEFSYIQRLLEGAYAACEAQAHALLLRPCPEDVSADKVRQFVRQTRVDGVLLTAPITDRTDITSLLVESRIAFAQISPRETNPLWTAVGPDDVEASRALTRYVVSLGHRRIGFIQGDPKHGASHKRLLGHLDGLREHGLEADPALIVAGRFDFDSGQDGLHALWRLSERPTAIIACNDDTAAGVVVAAHERGIRVPAMLSVAGFDDSPTATHTWPQLTTVRQPIAAIAFRATELLIATIAGEPPRQETFDCDLIARASMAKPAPLRRTGS